MALDAYCFRKVIVLSPMATARDAARAMSRHHVGIVLIGEHGLWRVKRNLQLLADDLRAASRPLQR